MAQLWGKITAETVIKLGKLALAFGQVNRITFHPDGVTPESDTDHTVMLALIACSIAAEDSSLDLGLVAQYALVHDLVEVYAGDTPTINPLDEEGKTDKQERENKALLRLTEEFKHSAPWLVRVLTSYEAQASKEARFIRALDKAMPKITHVLNKGVTPKEEGMNRHDLYDNHNKQYYVVEQYAQDLPVVMALLDELMGLAEEAMED